MRIETDKYLITGNKYDFVVQIKKSRKDSVFLEDKTKVGEEILGDKLYYPTLVQAFNAIPKELIRESDITQLEQIVELQEELLAEVRKLGEE